MTMVNRRPKFSNGLSLSIEILLFEQIYKALHIANKLIFRNIIAGYAGIEHPAT
jgi:hypothetical protein